MHTGLEIIGTTTTALTLPQETTFEEWQEWGNRLSRVERSVMWWIGDWCHFGKREYGDVAKMALESDYAHQTWKNAASVSGRIEKYRRRYLLSWTHHAEVASLPPAQQDKLLDEAEKKGWSTRDIKRAARRAKAGERGEVPLPEGKYRILYADPPWSYGNEMPPGTTTPEQYYPLMSTQEICHLPIGEMADKNSILFLWTTAPHCEESFEVIGSWGFEYKTQFIWDKVKHNMGHYNSVRHELLIICVRGSCTPDERKLFDSVQTIERGEHSAKPEEFRKIIDTLYPPPEKYIDRIELFNRRGAPDHWEVWGNEAVIN